MIGRYDVIFDIASPAEFAEQILQLVQVEWPDCIAENPLTGESLRQAMLGLAKMPEPAPRWGK